MWRDFDGLAKAAARALARGDPLGALNRVALRDYAPALAVRGIAMAQLGDPPVRRRSCGKRRAFGPKEAVARAPLSPRPRSRSSRAKLEDLLTRLKRRGSLHNRRNQLFCNA